MWGTCKTKNSCKRPSIKYFCQFSFFFWNKKPLNSLVPFSSLYVIESTKPSWKLPLTDSHFKQTKGKQLDPGVLGQMTENVHYCKLPYSFIDWNIGFVKIGTQALSTTVNWLFLIIQAFPTESPFQFNRPIKVILNSSHFAWVARVFISTDTIS